MPDDIDKEWKEFLEKDNEQAVDDLQAALNIQRAQELLIDWIEKGLVARDTTLEDALIALDKKKAELVGWEQDEDEDENKNGEEDKNQE